MTTIYIVECHREYEGSNLVAIYSGEDARQKARRRAYQENQNRSDSHSVTQWVTGPDGEMVEGDEWYAPKRPKQPEPPREYLEAQKRYQEQLARYERDCQEFVG